MCTLWADNEEGEGIDGQIICIISLAILYYIFICAFL